MMKQKTILGAVISIVAFTAHGEYTLKISRGNYPEGVRIENVNRNVPDSIWYKNGWTKDGWSAGDYGSSKDLAISPSHVAEGVCENALTLPCLKIEQGEWLNWDGCEVYPLFSDTYTVELRENGADAWITSGEFTESKSCWSRHMIDLSPYSGKEMEIRFVCRSDSGYMLALNNISIKKPSEHSFVSVNHTPKFFAVGDLDDGYAQAEITVMNTGLTVSDAIVGIMVDGNIVSSLQEDTEWPTGESRTISIPLPLALNKRAEYSITIEPAGGEILSLSESFAYCTSFKRYLYVDKGTGMWCNACPEGTIVMEELKETYGDSMIAVETHNGDPLADDVYFSWLRFYSIPHLMLNHIQTTKGENASRFEKQLCVPTEMGIDITGLTVKSNGDLCATASVRTSESFTATDRTYRIGYVLTRNVSGDEQVAYYQKNICTIAGFRQYHYLPSRMTYRMCYFPDVTIPSQVATMSESPAFTGVNGSLPESLEPGESYDCEWDIPIPEGFDSFDGLRLVAFVLDAGTQQIINSTAMLIDDCAGIEVITDDAPASRGEQIFTIEGRKVGGERSTLLPGLYIINGKKVMKK
ncbi:MAG: hypothetical protein K2N48_07930 [Muribaculaceae bacterium]|nr:hypothetical protein [Muribaculaceae bacterium]